MYTDVTESLTTKKTKPQCMLCGVMMGCIHILYMSGKIVYTVSYATNCKYYKKILRSYKNPPTKIGHLKGPHSAACILHNQKSPI